MFLSSTLPRAAAANKRGSVPATATAAAPSESCFPPVASPLLLMECGRFVVGGLFLNFD